MDCSANPNEFMAAFQVRTFGSFGDDISCCYQAFVCLSRLLVGKIGGTFPVRCEAFGHHMSNPDPDTPDITDRDDVIWFLEHNDIPLPEGLTVEKIRDRGTWWRFEDDAFSFRLERHPSPLFSMSPAGSPARWHIRKRYRYDLTTREWDVTEVHREFHFDAWLLIDAEFEQLGRKGMWEEAINQVQAADDPEATLEEEFTAMAEFYRNVFSDVPEDTVDEMLTVLKNEFRRRAGLD